jgi:hypothetical protein
LIVASQWAKAGGDLQQGHDIGPLGTQIIARAVNQVPGQYEKIRFGQEARCDDHRSMLMFAYKLNGIEDTFPNPPFLWSFLTVTANLGLY